MESQHAPHDMICTCIITRTKTGTSHVFGGETPELLIAEMMSHRWLVENESEQACLATAQRLVTQGDHDGAQEMLALFLGESNMIFDRIRVRRAPRRREGPWWMQLDIMVALLLAAFVLLPLLIAVLV